MSENGRPVFLYSGTGNTFVLVDARTAPVAEPRQAAVAMCREHGVDGLLVMETTPKAEIRMRIFNPDGSEASMCGNGSRCAAHWAHTVAGIRTPMKIETGAGVLSAEVRGEEVKVLLTPPRNARGPLKIAAGGNNFEGWFIDTGVPHTVIPVPKVAVMDIERLGPAIRNDAQFKPAGTNVSFMERQFGNKIKIRTYERGVEAETQACGTGAAACALTAARVYGLASPVEVETPSKEILQIHFTQTGGNFTEVHLEGPVRQMKAERPKGKS